MLPYILAVVGGYLIGSSSDKKVIPNQIFADGGELIDGSPKITIYEEDYKTKAKYLKGDIGIYGRLLGSFKTGDIRYEFKPDRFNNKESEDYYNENSEKIEYEILKYNNLYQLEKSKIEKFVEGELGDLTDVDEYDYRSELEAILKAIDQNDFKNEYEEDEDEIEYSAETKVMTRFDLPFEVKFEVEIKFDYDGKTINNSIELSGYPFDYEGMYAQGLISKKHYEKINKFFDVLYQEAYDNSLP